MVLVRIIAVLLGIAFALAIAYLWTRRRAYLDWAWRVFVLALVCALGLLGFYFVERLFLT